MRNIPTAAALVTYVAACASAAPQPPSLRLGNNVEPKRMSVELTLSPSREDFRATFRFNCI